MYNDVKVVEKQACALRDRIEAYSLPSSSTAAASLGPRNMANESCVSQLSNKLLFIKKKLRMDEMPILLHFVTLNMTTLRVIDR